MTSRIRLEFPETGGRAVVVHHVCSMLGLPNDVAADTDADRTAKRHRPFVRGSAPASCFASGGQGMLLDTVGYSPALALSLSSRCG